MLDFRFEVGQIHIRKVRVDGLVLASDVQLQFCIQTSALRLCFDEILCLFCRSNVSAESCLKNEPPRLTEIIPRQRLDLARLGIIHDRYAGSARGAGGAQVARGALHAGRR